MLRLALADPALQAIATAAASPEQVKQHHVHAHSSVDVVIPINLICTDYTYNVQHQLYLVCQGRQMPSSG